MKLLFVDDTDFCNNTYLSQKYETVVVKTKTEALELIGKEKFFCAFVNAKFNSNFVEQIKSIDSDIAVYLFNTTNNFIGLVEHTLLIDGYFVSPTKDTIEKALYKLALRTHVFR